MQNSDMSASQMLTATGGKHIIKTTQGITTKIEHGKAKLPTWLSSLPSQHA